MKTPLLSLLAVSLVAPIAPATPFSAFIDIGPPTGRVEAGAVASGGSADGTNGQNLAPVSLTATTGQSFSFGISNVNTEGATQGAIDWRDRGNAPDGPGNYLAEDFVKNNSGIVRLSFGGLPMGIYSVTTTHLDPPNSQSSNIEGWVNDARGGNGFKATGIIGDASYPGHPANSGAPGLSGLTPEIIQAHTMTVGAVAGSAGALQIVYNGRDDVDDDETPVNGVQLDLVTPLRNFALLDIGPTAQRVMSGSTGVGSANNNVNNTGLTNAPVTADTGDIFQASLSLVDWRDRGDGSNANGHITTTWPKTL